MHPTSLPNEYGIGDLGSAAYDFVDFLHETGQKLWQVLPIGPTGYGNSPYASFSAFAGNTNLISPELLKKQGFLDEEDLTDLPEFDKNKIDYPKVVEFKSGLFRKSFEKFKERVSEKEKDNFFYFCDMNNYWLQDFALFMSIKEYYEAEAKNENRENACKTWSDWQPEILSRDPAYLNEVNNKLGDEVFYHKYLQYQFFKQWLQLKSYANEKGISLIGDIPIFVAYDSADVWANPDLFLLDKKGLPIEVAGVPPDYFSETGQLWGNPLYNWNELERRGFDWWIERIRMTLNLVDILRIDHFRGFESYWAIPYGSPNAINGEWKKAPGKELFNAIKASLGKLAIVAEDLGIITPEVEELRDHFNFPGMKILQFAFTNTGKDPFLPHNYKSNCVVYPGTHDNDTCLGWYKTAPEKEKAYFLRYSGVTEEKDLHWGFMKIGMNSVANQFIFAIQDLFGLDTDARMNMPSKPDGNWEWRLDPALLTQEVKDKLKAMTTDAYR